MTVNTRHRRKVLLIWLGLLSLCLFIVCTKIASGNAFNTNILSLLPSQNETPDAQQHEQWRAKLSSNQSLQRSFVLMLQHPDSKRAKQAAQKLRAQFNNLKSVHLADDDAELLQQLNDFYKPYRQQILTPELRQYLSTGSKEDIANDILKSLYSPVRIIRPYTITEDPLNIAGSWLTAIFPNTGNVSPGEIPSISREGQTWYLIRGSVEGNPFQVASHSTFLEIITAFNTSHPEIELVRSGMVFHAAEAATLAEREISTVGLGSIIAIIVLVLAVLRSTTALVAISITLGSSVLVALAACLLVFDQVHLITLAFGSTLLGLAVDYCFHFLMKYRKTGDAISAEKLIRRGLLLSLCSSVLAYGIQLLSPFPGLQQFAVFVAAGLVAAALSIYVISHFFADKRLANSTEHYLKIWCFFSGIYQNIYRARLIFIPALMLLVVGLTYSLVTTTVKDDIRLLNTSSTTLLKNEQQVQSLLGGIDTQRYWVAYGETTQQRLASTSQLVEHLITNSPGAILMAPTQLSPSIAQQQADYALVQAKLYSHDGAIKRLCAQLANDCKSFMAEQPRFTTGLTPDVIPEIVTQQLPAMLASDDTHSVVYAYKDSIEHKKLHSLISSTNNANFYYVDQVADISNTLAGFRSEVSRLLGLFLLVFAFISFLLDRKRALLVIGCVMLSQLAGLAFSVSDGITLFHMLALLLVLGISADTVIFYLELGLDADTWLASTLSMLTSILAFGLLSLSQVPLLHHFGSVVFFGLLCAWLLTPVLYQFAKLNPLGGKLAEK